MSAQQLHRNPPFRAEHLGSLLRPQDLLDKRTAVQKGEAKSEELKPVEDAAIDDIVKKQQEWGFRGISDGEYRCVQYTHTHSLSLSLPT